MNRNEFVSQLQNALGDIPSEAKDEIMYDYREHFEIGLEQGKTEEEICAGLGDPRTIGKQYKAEYIVSQADSNRSAVNIIRAVLAALNLGFLNIIFMIPVFTVLTAVLTGFFAISLSLILAGAGIFTATLLSPLMPLLIFLPEINPIILILASISIACLGLLSGMGTIRFAKFLYKLFIICIKTNMRIIDKQESDGDLYV